MAMTLLPRPRSEATLLRESLSCSTWEAVFATIHVALTQGIFLTNYVLDLGASNLEVGVIESLPYLLQFCYLLSPMLVRRFQQRKVVTVTFSALHRLAWLVLILLMYVDWEPAIKHGLLILTMLLSNACSVIATNAWFSWMADLIPPTIRGAYYGRRNAFLGLTSVIAILIGSQMLSFFRDLGLGPAGYTLCFSVAIASALFSARMLWKQHEPEPRPIPKIPIRDLVRITKERPLLWDYIRFFTLWQFGLGVAAAFFGVHMVKTLHMTPAQMGYQALLSSIAAFFGSRLWGKARDRIGDRPVLLASGVLVAANVWIWLWAVEGFLWPVWILSLIAGFSWAGFNLAAFSWPQVLCGVEDRQYTFGLMGMLSGPGFVAGSLLGGILTTYLPEVLYSSGDFRFLHYHLVFLVSSAARFTAILCLSRWSRRAEQGNCSLFQCMVDCYKEFIRK
jgi:MFS family permease